MDCPDLHKIQEIIFTTRDGKLRSELVAHADQCADCRKKIAQFITLQDWLTHHESTGTEKSHSDECYSSIQLLDYLENNYTSIKNTEIQKHIASCTGCRNELVQLYRYLDELGSINEQAEAKKTHAIEVLPLKGWIDNIILQIASFFRMPAGNYRYALLSVLAIIFIFSFSLFYPGDQSGIITRHSEISSDLQEVLILFPSPEQIINSHDFVFTWQGPSGVTHYDFILLDENGEIIFENQTSTPENRLPVSIMLKPGMKYFWQVEAHLTQDRIIISEMPGFKYQPDLD